MAIFVDLTEPGIVVQELARRAALETPKMVVERTILHKREGLGVRARGKHPFYGIGADYVIADDAGHPMAAVERKTLEDLAKSASLRDARANEGTKLFRQLHELRAHPSPIFLLEGEPSLIYRRVEPALLGVQLWCARQGISILYTTGPLSSAHAVLLLARRLRGELILDSPGAFRWPAALRENAEVPTRPLAGRGGGS